MLGTILVEEEAHDSALPLLEESVALARAVDDPVLLAFTSSNLAGGLLSARELERFHEVGHEALDLARKVGDTITEKATLLNLGLAAVLGDDPVSGAARFAESLDLARELGIRWVCSNASKGSRRRRRRAGGRSKPHGCSAPRRRSRGRRSSCSNP